MRRRMMSIVAGICTAICLSILNPRMASAQAILPQNSTIIVIEEGGRSSPIPIRLTRPAHGSITLTLNGTAKFPKSVRRYVRRNNQGNRGEQEVTIPDIVTGPPNEESFLSVADSRGALAPDVRIITALREAFETLNFSYNSVGSSILVSGDHFAVIDEESFVAALVNSSEIPRTVTTGSDFSDRGTESVILDEGATIYTRNICTRVFTPDVGKPKTMRAGSGQVIWNISAPYAGNSIKDENISSNNPSTLRCPRRTGATDYFVDGIYSTWPRLTYKIPDHCTATRKTGSVSCCCNRLASALYGQCKFIDPRQFADWPDTGKLCPPK